MGIKGEIGLAQFIGSTRFVELTEFVGLIEFIELTELLGFVEFGSLGRFKSLRTGSDSLMKAKFP